jgi:hypothetical protein
MKRKNTTSALMARLQQSNAVKRRAVESTDQAQEEKPDDLFIFPTRFPENFTPLVTASMLATDVAPLVESEFGKQYDENMSLIHAMYITKSSNILFPSINDPTQQHLQRYLYKKKYLTKPLKKDCLDRNGKMVRQKQKAAPMYPRRITFLNGGNAFFPFSEWTNVFAKRANDITDGSSLFDNDVAYSSEGMNAFFEIDYRSRNSAVPPDEILAHALACQDIMKEYFHLETDTTDFRMWVLTCLPKPKRVQGLEKPVIANGAHIIFPKITIGADQGRQLCTSANYRIGMKFGRINVVDDCYKDSATTLRPIHCMKLEACPDCENIEELRFQCTTCSASGKIGTGSVYRPTCLVSSDGMDLSDEREKLIANNFAQVVCETSIVPPSDLGEFSPGFRRPTTEPIYIPPAMRSVHKDDKGKDYVFKADRAAMSRRAAFEVITDDSILSALRGEIRLYHPAYKGAILANVSKKKMCYFVNISSGGRSFCRICCRTGRDHSGNRVYFRFDYRGKTITQHCYANDCKQLMAKDKTVKTRLAQNFNIIHSSVLFPNLHTFSSKPKTKKEQMDECDQFLEQN